MTNLTTTISLEQAIRLHDALRDALYAEGAKKNHGWLTTSYRNAEPSDITYIGLSEDGTSVDFGIAVWTSQTGGSTEFIDATVDRAAVETAIETALAEVAGEESS